MNSSTSISLNDRFSIINSARPETPRRARSRSKPRNIPNNTVVKMIQGSQKSKQFISMLDKKHQLLSLAKKLKNKSLRAARTKNQPNNIVRRPTVNANRNRKLKRNAVANNFSVKDRLGNRQSRSRFRRSVMNEQQQQMARGRSRSRSRMARSNSQPNLRRSNSQMNLNQQQQQTQQRVRLNRNNFRRARSRSRTNLNQRSNSRPNLSRANSRQNLNSVNNRLGANKTAPLRRAIRRRFGNQLNVPRANGIIRGRIRRNNKPVQGNQLARKMRNNQNAPNGGVQQRGRQLKRNQGGPMRGRSRSRNAVNRGNQNGRQQQQQQQQKRPFSGGNSRRGRSRNRQTRRGGQQGGAGVNGGQKKADVTKEMLDKQLDQYMQSSS